MNLSAAPVALVPPAVVALMSTVPADRAGLITVQVFASLQLTCVPAVEPNLKLVPVVPATKPVPLIVTVVPPAVGPLAGLIAVTVGAPR